MKVNESPDLGPIGWGMAMFAVAAVFIAMILTGDLSNPTCAEGLEPVRQDGRSLVCERLVEPPAKDSAPLGKNS